MNLDFFSKKSSHQTLKTIILALAVLGAGLLIILLVVTLLRAGLFRAEEAVKNNYLKKEELVILKPANPGDEPVTLPIKQTLFEYVEVRDSCGPYFDGECVNARSGPGGEYPVITRLRNGAVLKVGGVVEREGRAWYKIVFDEILRYPERVSADFYVASDFTEALVDEGIKDLNGEKRTTSKYILIDRTKQKLSAYDGDELFMESTISTGLEFTPTPRGVFTIFRKTPSRYMQGPIPGITNTYYDLPGVPWNLYFTEQGAVIHGTYWHNRFGKPSSNGCANLTPIDARKLYEWAELGMKVIVRD